MMAALRKSELPMLSALLVGVLHVAERADCAVHGLSLDSRTLREGELFLACAGHTRHGRDYIEQAVAAGAAAVLWEASSGDEDPLTWRTAPSGRAVPILAVPQLSQLVGVIADRFYGQPSRTMFVAGVTGTNGKTSCSQFLAQALSQDGPCGVIGTLGNGLYGALQETRHTTPDAITIHATLADWRARGAHSAVMEVSSHGLEQGRVRGVLFHTAVFTNLTREHLDYHGDMTAYGGAKRRLFEMEGLRCAVINSDDAYGRELLRSLSPAVEAISYGLEIHGAPPAIYGHDLHLDADGLRLQVSTAWGDGVLHSRLLGRFNASNLLAVLGVLLSRGVAMPVALERLAQLATVPGRMERFGGGANPLLVVDYAHTPDALQQALSALREHTQGRLWCVFGCGGDRDRGKRPEMGAIAERLADFVIVTDDNPRHEDPWDIVAGILGGMTNPDAVYVERDRRLAIAKALRNAAVDDVILIAGKGHESYQQFGERRVPYSDVATVQQLLAEGGA